MPNRAGGHDIRRDETDTRARALAPAPPEQERQA